MHGSRKRSPARSSTDQDLDFCTLLTVLACCEVKSMPLPQLPFVGVLTLFASSDTFHTPDHVWHVQFARASTVISPAAFPFLFSC